MKEEWYTDFFDKLYYETYAPFEEEERNRREAEFIAKALNIKPGELVLDLACGYGRHALILSQMGYRVVGLDLSDTLLEIAMNTAKAKNIPEDVLRFVKGDMRSLPWREEFDGIYCFYTSFGYFSHQENIEVLSEVNKSLKRDRWFLLDIWNRERMIREFRERYWYESGGYLVLEDRKLDLTEMEMRERRIFIKGNKQIERQIKIKFYSAREIIEMLKTTGFKEIKLYGDYKFSKYDINSPRMVVVARK
jgi:SAM-dependent methyltransferase